MPARLGVLALVVVLVAGLGIWWWWPKENREPFDQAVGELAAAAAVHYRTSKDGGESTSDVTVTSHGDAVGTVAGSGSQFRTLQVGDDLYVRFDGDLPVATGLPEQFQKDKWVTGSTDPTGIGTEPPLAPREFADALRGALDRTAEFPSESDPGTTVAGVAALSVTTPSGELSVSKDAPYRVLRFVPTGAAGGSPAPPLPSFPPRGSGPDEGAPQPAPGGGQPGADRLLRELGTIDVDPMSPVDVDQVYEALEAGVDQLADAVDTDVDLRVTGDLQLACSEGGCTVTANVTNTSPGSSSVGGVNAVLTATVSVEGQPAGGCSNRTVLPTGGGSISCAAPSAGPVWSATKARKAAAAQAEANARAAAAPGTVVTVPYQVLSTAQGTVYATPQIDIGQEKDRLRRQRSVANCPPTPNSFATGTRVLLADGSSLPIEAVTAGTRVRSADPVSGRTSTEPVLATITGNGGRHLDELTVSDGRSTGTVTATANHPFWSPAERAWMDAGSLRPGHRLYTDDGAAVRVVGSRSGVPAHQVHNLSIAGPHTYYVLAGDTPLLVHNSTRECGADLGENWKPKPAAHVCGRGGCEDVADDIHSRIGGTIYRIKDKYSAPQLGKFRGVDSGWNYHDVVIKDGRVFDATTGRHGEPIGEYRRNFEYPDDLTFTPRAPGER